MRLFGAQGYRATTIVQIEEAAGLSPGSGGLYHHFRSKEELLDAGIDRHLDRMRALRDIRAVLGRLPDRDAELAVLARYGLQVLAEETPMLRLVASEQADPPAALERARAIGLAVLRHELRDWMTDLAPEIAPADVAPVAAVACDALIARHLQATLLVPSSTASDPTELDDDAFVTEWVALVAARLDRLATS